MRESIRVSNESKANGHAVSLEDKAGPRIESVVSREEFRELIEESRGPWYVGIDLGDKRSRFSLFDATSGPAVAEGVIVTTRTELREWFSGLPKMRVALEVGTHSPWVSESLESFGHEVVVANPRKMESIHKNRRKNDRTDAKTLGRLLRADRELLYPIQHRGAEARRDLTLLRARDSLVSVRTELINTVRGLVKSVGGRVPTCSADSFHKQARKYVPAEIERAILPLIEQIDAMTTQIGEYDRIVKAMAERKYGNDTGGMRQINGVGALTSLAYVLTLENPGRFQKSRDVGPYLGLVPRQDESGESSRQLGITKQGDMMMRRLLVTSAHYILGPFGKECDLRNWGLKIAARGGKNAKKRAVVAVARKLAVLLHRLWVTGELYEPLHNSKVESGLRQEAAAGDSGR
jgi:transposase